MKTGCGDNFAVAYRTAMHLHERWPGVLVGCGQHVSEGLSRSWRNLVDARPAQRGPPATSPTFGTTNLEKTKHCFCLKNLVGARGFEPPTPSLPDAGSALILQGFLRKPHNPSTIENAAISTATVNRIRPSGQPVRPLVLRTRSLPI